MVNEKLKQELNNKNVLFIGPVYFGYEKTIVSLMEECGAAVDFIQENLDVRSVVNGLVNKLPVNLCKKIRDIQHKRQIDSLKGKNYDLILGIRMDFFDDYLCALLREYWPNAKFCLYFWDSCKNMRRPKEVAKYFDKVSSFDRMDCEEMADSGWNFRPLFYIKEYEHASAKSNKDIDVLYVSSLFPNRARSYIALREYCKKHNLNLKTLFYVKESIYKVQKNKISEYAKIEPECIRFKSIDKAEIIDLMGRSKVMFDCSHARQSGLTMRTVECVGAEQLLASTNEDLKNYDFYRDDNICILEEDNFEGLAEFVANRQYQPLEKNLYEKYSISSWLLDIIGA